MHATSARALQALAVTAADLVIPCWLECGQSCAVCILVLLS